MTRNPSARNANTRNTRILLLSFDPEKVKLREAALRAEGFEVKGVYSPGQARFEIEMGTCGIFITCRLVPDIVNRDLMNLFRGYCPDHGLIILVTGDERPSARPYEPQADVRVPESRDPEGVVRAVQERLRTSEVGSPAVE